MGERMTDSHRKAVKAYKQKLKEEGQAQVTFWITPPRLKSLDRLAKVSGSRQKALDKLLDMMTLDTGI